MNFVAIDFETANEKRNSPCSLGLTVVEHGKITLERYWLIRPKEFRFVPMNIMIHGIRPGQVEHEPEFHTLWPEISSYLTGNLVVAHNASFDMSVLRSTLDAYGINYPNFNYVCTMLMSKHFYNFLDNAKLNTVNDHLGFKFDHHQASADATACANILLSISQELKTTDINEIASATGITIGKLYPNGYDRSSSKGRYQVSNSWNQPAKVKHVSFDPTFFCNKHIAFTGPLKKMSRAEAIDKVYQYGGSYSSTVSKKTNVLVTNVPNPMQLPYDQMSTKLRKAMKLIQDGYDIQILDESVMYGE